MLRLSPVPYLPAAPLESDILGPGSRRQAGVPPLSLSRGSTEPPLQSQRHKTDLDAWPGFGMVKALTLETGHTDPKSSTVRPGVPNSGK